MRGISVPALGSGRDNIMLWWRPEEAVTYGYRDGWTPTGDAFYFAGTGQRGEQTFDAPLQENGRLRDHVKNGHRVRLLRYIRDNYVRYMGELRLDPSNPHQWVDGIDANGDRRRMIQFRLLPVGDVLRVPGDPTREEVSPHPTPEPVTQVGAAPATTPLEQLTSHRLLRLLEARELEVRQVELRLVHSFHAWLTRLGIDSSGLRIPYAPECRDLRADLYLPRLNVLVEAKSSTAREKLRSAIGQLLDYQRLLTPRPKLCVLTPGEPSYDMVELLDSLSIGCAWPVGSARFDVRPWSLLS